MDNQFYKNSEARKKSPVTSRPDLVAARNAELQQHIKTLRFSDLDKNPTDSRIFFRRADLSCYAVLSPARVDELRRKHRLEKFLDAERESGIIIPTAALDDPYRIGTKAGDDAGANAINAGAV